MIDGVEISDLRSPTVHSKETRVDAGRMLRQHFHAFDHIQIIASGTVELKKGNEPARYITGPKHIIIQAGIMHSFRAVTDAVVYCVHSAGCIDSNLNDFEG